MSAHRWMLTILLAGHLAVTLAFSLMVPLAEAPDEADHWAYVVYLAKERTLPVGPAMTQSKHPPLYHVTAAAIASLAGPNNDFLRPNPNVQLTPEPGWTPNFFIHSEAEGWPWQGGVLAFRLVRFWSALLSTATVAVTYALARTAFPAQPRLALAATGVLAFLPEFAFIGGSINNDNAAALFGALGLWGGLRLYRAGGRLASAWWTPLALGLGLLSKTSTIGLWPAVGAAIILGAAGATEANANWDAAWRRRVLRSWRRWLLTGTVVFGLALLVAMPWFARNWRLYADPFGLNVAMQTVDLRTSPWTWADTTWLLRGWFVSFWGKFGGAGHIPMPAWVYLLLGVVSLGSVAGLLRQGLVRKRSLPGEPLVILVLAAVGVAAVMWRYSLIALGTDQGRLLFPAVSALVILFAAGLLAWTDDRAELGAAVAMVLLTALLSLFALIGVVGPAFVHAYGVGEAPISACQAAACIAAVHAKGGGPCMHGPPPLVAIGRGERI